MEDKRPLQSIPDDELLHRLADLTSQSRRAEADIVAHIAEVEERRLYAREAFSSMFAYCMDVLHFSEAEAYLRIWASRASRKHPMLLTMLADGRVHLTAIVKLAPHLTLENRDGLLERATHKSKRQILELVAEIAPRPDLPGLVRKLPRGRLRTLAGPLVVPSRGDSSIPLPGTEPRRELGPDAVAAPQPAAQQDEAVPSSSSASAPPASRLAIASPASPPVVEPLSPGRYKVQFTASAEFRHKLERLGALMGSAALDGDLAAVIEQAVTEKLERLEARRLARTKAPRNGPVERDTGTRLDLSPSSRYIPAALRRAVSERDGGRCRYVDAKGRRCQEERGLEFHHRHPFGHGGVHSLANVAQVCRAHNAYLAECDYGKDAMARRRHPRNPASHAPADSSVPARESVDTP